MPVLLGVHAWIRETYKEGVNYQIIVNKKLVLIEL